MSSRLAEKEGRRRERLERERGRQAEERRRRVLGRLSYIALGVAVLGAAVAAILVSSGGHHRTAQAAQAGDPFGPHYAGLVERRQAAHVPTMMDTMNSPVHFHPQLMLYVDGKRVTVPANIGIDPAQDAMQMAGLHTHDASGTIHVEGVSGARLGQFFSIWGVPLSGARLGPYRAGAGDAVRMWVDGKPSTAFGRLKLADGQRIVISYGQKAAPPPAA
jgi:hypothetical protein